MNFERSSQAKSWMFNEESLSACRLKALQSNEMTTSTKPRKFASGFHQRYNWGEETHAASLKKTRSAAQYISLEYQETLVRFHSHQLQALVGSRAVFLSLRTSDRVLSTGIMLFRRFYLSNNIIDTDLRKISVACAFFAAKLEEERVDVSSLSSSCFI
jgi:hypothetical protein